MPITTPQRTQPTQKMKVFPRGAGSVAFTEFWERFSFYGLQAILFYYLIFSVQEGGLALSSSVASSIVGAYGGLIYISQILGAWVGDRVLSPLKTVLGGGVVILGGHLALAFVPGLIGVFVGLGFLVLGTGALKTNITSVFGIIVDEQGTTSRDSSFSYYYTAIMAGVALGPLGTGFLQSSLGFHWGFGAAAVGMAFGLVVYVLSTKKLPDRARHVANPLGTRGKWNAVLVTLAVCAILVAATLLGLITLENLAALASALAIAAASIYFFVLLSSGNHSNAEKRQIWGYLPVFVASCVYMAVGYQLYTAVATLIATEVDLHIGDWEFPIAWVTGIAGFAPLIAGPILASVWNRQGERQAKPPVKVATSLLIQAVTHSCLLLWAVVSGDWGVPLLFILLFMFVSFTGEMFVGPVGLSLATSIGPARARSQLVALNFLTLAIGGSLGGVLGGMYTVLDHTPYFSMIVAVAAVTALLLIVFRRSIASLLSTARVQ